MRMHLKFVLVAGLMAAPTAGDVVKIQNMAYLPFAAARRLA